MLKVVVAPSLVRILGQYRMKYKGSILSHPHIRNQTSSDCHSCSKSVTRGVGPDEYDKAARAAKETHVRFLRCMWEGCEGVLSVCVTMYIPKLKAVANNILGRQSMAHPRKSQPHRGIKDTIRYAVLNGCIDPEPLIAVTSDTVSCSCCSSSCCRLATTKLYTCPSKIKFIKKQSVN
jgi:hypothetical protein